MNRNSNRSFGKSSQRSKSDNDTSKSAPRLRKPADNNFRGREGQSEFKKSNRDFSGNNDRFEKKEGGFRSREASSSRPDFKKSSGRDFSSDRGNRFEKKEGGFRSREESSSRPDFKKSSGRDFSSDRGNRFEKKEGGFRSRENSSSRPDFKKSSDRDFSSDKGGRFEKKEGGFRSRENSSSRSDFKKSSDRDFSSDRGGRFDKKEGGFRSRENSSFRSDFKKSSDRDFSSDRGGRFDKKEGGFRSRENSSSRPDFKKSSDRDFSSDRGGRFDKKEGGFRSRENSSSRPDFKKSSDRDFSSDKGGNREGGYFERKEANARSRAEAARPKFKSRGGRNNFSEDKSDKFVNKYARRNNDYDQDGPPSYDFKHYEKHHKNEPDRSIEQGIRLNRYIANSGVCSRRDADKLIHDGLISVNGTVVTEMGFRVQPTDVVKYGKKKLSREKNVYVLLNKPKDFITTTDDPEERKTVMQLVASACEERIYPVGRLDRNTTGLLLLTNDGELADKLSHPSQKITKIYQVDLDKPLTEEDYEKIMAGLELEDGTAQVDELEILSPDRSILGIAIHIGRNRIVRRIFEHLGYDVVRLDRVMYAGLDKKNLSRGHWRYLTEKEVINLKYFLK
ncbi:23S rRNA pseudouridine2605 synthase [Flexibacter flexilis DSM 6793]|uniref:Pseudouridine synthase n=1 Tax=Flexibacter flexilis DSM 6793 TaxID=927664 RepID=A0A1I1LVT8_9BACT|nr:pseudouridine synthase [Flexibacter flexilis]SFC73600.1 23S rRNA pseudouridine2605 synthase [Flexibacter flexilis DSM 6793]